MGNIGTPLPAIRIKEPQRMPVITLPVPTEVPVLEPELVPVRRG